MKIKKLTLNNFMAFGNAEMNWSDNINIICGENTFESDVFFDKAT